MAQENAKILIIYFIRIIFTFFYSITNFIFTCVTCDSSKKVKRYKGFWRHRFKRLGCTELAPVCAVSGPSGEKAPKASQLGGTGLFEHEVAESLTAHTPLHLLLNLIAHHGAELRHKLLAGQRFVSGSLAPFLIVVVNGFA